MLSRSQAWVKRNSITGRACATSARCCSNALANCAAEACGAPGVRPKGCNPALQLRCQERASSGAIRPGGSVPWFISARRAARKALGAARSCKAVLDMVLVS